MANTGKRLAGYVPDYVVFDLETTGTSVKSDDIIEISAVKAVAGVAIDSFSTLVDPQRDIPAAASAINGITDEMTAGAPHLEEALAEFLDFIGDFVLVGHNIRSFDLKFIYRDAVRLFGRQVTNDYIDTLHMARRCLPQLGRHRLTDVAAYFHIDTAGAHRALNDCMMNQKCYEAMAKLQPKGEKVCPECGGELVKRNGKFGEFWGCSNFPGCRYTKKA